MMKLMMVLHGVHLCISRHLIQGLLAYLREQAWEIGTAFARSFPNTVLILNTSILKMKPQRLCTL